MSMVHIIIWKCNDGSANGVIRAYESEGDARDDLEMLQENCTAKVFDLVSIPVRGSLAKAGAA